MNARWFRDHLGSLVFAVAFVAILGGILWFLRQAAAQQAVIVAELENQQRELQSLRGRPIYPSTENIDVLKRDREKIRQLYADMQAAITRKPVDTPKLERPIDFSQFRLATVNRLTETAARGRLKIPERYAFGFSRYDAMFPCSNPFVPAEDCKRLLALLAKQLKIVEMITGLLIESKVESLSYIRRTEVESGPGSADALDIAIKADPKALFHTYPFEIQFTCDTHALRALLTKLGRADSLFVIRSVKVDSTGNRIQLPSVSGLVREPLPRAPVFGRGRGEPEPPMVEETPRFADVRQLSVTLRLDLVELNVSQPRPGRS